MAIFSESPSPGPVPRSSAHPVTTFGERPLEVFQRVRAATRELCAPLEIEDFGLQSMPDTSPVKWHLAHTAWFFETFVLQAFTEHHEPFHPQFGYLFNSYYEAVGRMHPRTQRGLLSRPTVAEVFRYRESVDERVTRWLERGSASPEQLAIVELGLHHEQQHQELILTDLKHGLFHNALRPAYITGGAPAVRQAGQTPPKPSWTSHPGGITEIGFRGEGFHFDNEGPAHQALLQPFAMADALVTCGEYLEFMADGGYERVDLWLSAGWAAVQGGEWTAPLYWELRDGQWWHFTLRGMQPVDPAQPVCHLSLFEADAYARWSNARLPTEFEWEAWARDKPVEGNFQESGAFHPRAPQAGGNQTFGDTWVWTQSAYSPYPGFTPPPGALGEYNGKFMCSQLVLRGGSCATPQGHVRPTYRNFFYPPNRWQFSGIRLAKQPSEPKQP